MFHEAVQHNPQNTRALMGIAHLHFSRGERDQCQAQCRKILLAENQSTYIPLGEVHRLANPGKVPLEIIEVQSGSYLGEDDIVRFEDSYGR